MTSAISSLPAAGRRSEKSLFTRQPSNFFGGRRYPTRPGRRDSGHFAGGFFEQVVDQSLVGLGLFGGHAAKLAEGAGFDFKNKERSSMPSGLACAEKLGRPGRRREHSG
jgi:hypothetical protein